MKHNKAVLPSLRRWHISLFRHTWQPVQVTTSTTKNNTHKDKLQIENDRQKINVNVRMKMTKVS